jgi:hypothetical protein
LAEFGTGWIPWGDAAADPVKGIRLMSQLLSELGKDVKTIQVVGTLPIRTMDDRIDLPATLAPVGELIEAGVTDCRLNLHLPTDRSEVLDLVSPIVQGFRSEVGQGG